MECAYDEACQERMICPPCPFALPLPFFFSGTTGTPTDKSSVPLAITGFRLSHSGWDTGPFSVGQVGQFVPIEGLAVCPRGGFAARNLSRLPHPAGAVSVVGAALAAFKVTALISRVNKNIGLRMPPHLLPKIRMFLEIISHF